MSQVAMVSEIARRQGMSPQHLFTAIEIPVEPRTSDLGSADPVALTIQAGSNRRSTALRSGRP